MTSRAGPIAMGMDFLAAALTLLRAPKAEHRERFDAAKVVDALFPSREPPESLVTELLLAIDARAGYAPHQARR